MGRRRRNSVVPFVVLGAAVSIGVVALTASRFGWRRTKTEIETSEETPEVETTEAPDALESPETPKPEPRFKPAPPRPANAARWDSPPPEYADGGPPPP